MQNKNYDAAGDEFAKLLQNQTNNPRRSANNFLAGINAHNLGVLAVLSGRFEEALQRFHQAVDWKRKSFGAQHTQVALSLEEQGIIYFAQQEWDKALEVMNKCGKVNSPQLQVMVLNNLACVHLARHNHVAAMITLRNARDLHHEEGRKLDLLHSAQTIGNLGYVLIQMKQYEEARAMLEEALLVSDTTVVCLRIHVCMCFVLFESRSCRLVSHPPMYIRTNNNRQIQQSVLNDDNHRAIRDTRSNLEFTNAFHSL